MSWLYSLVFAGLVFSYQNASVDTYRASISEPGTPAAIRSDETERFEQTYPLSANGRVSVSNVNGSIIINAWDRNEVKLVAVKTADSKERLADVEIKVDARPDYVSVETSYDSWKNRNSGDRWRNGKLEVNYELNVPRGAVLNEIETVNGSVSVADFSNLVKISAVNGNVKATNLRGTANLSTVNGEVFANFDRLESTTKIYLDTVNGTVNLSIPSDSNATLRADSVNGSISNDFGLPVRKGKYVGRDLYGRVGSGEVQVKLSSVNGQLSIGRNKDGRSPSPATDLLQQKSKDDEDMDDDNDNDEDSVQLNSARMNKDIAQAMKAANKETAAAMKQTRKELEKIQPQIEKINAEALKKAADMINNADVQASIDAGIQAGVQVSAKVAADLRNIRFSSLPRVEKRSDAIPVKGTPKVTVLAPGCSVRVKGWDRPEVQYTLIKFSSNQDPRDTPLTEDHSESAVNIRVQEAGPGLPGMDDLPRTRIEIFVPKKSNLKITADGEIRLENVSGEIDLSGNEESVDVRDVDGKMTVATKCGQVRVIGFEGDLKAKTEDGNIFLEGKFNGLSADAADGTVVLTLPNDANATIASNTHVEGQGVDIVKEKDDLWRVGKGGPAYNFDFNDGHLIVRSSAEIIN